MGFLTRFNEPIYAIFRIIFGLLFASHGAQTIFGVLGGLTVDAPLPLVDGLCGLHRQRRDGRRLLHGARLGRLLAPGQPRRGRGPLLLRLPLHRRPRRRPLERRRHARSGRPNRRQDRRRPHAALIRETGPAADLPRGDEATRLAEEYVRQGRCRLA